MVATPPYLSRLNTPYSVLPGAFLPNSSPRLTLSKNCPQQALIQQKYLRSMTMVATPPYLSRLNTPYSVLPGAFLPNSSPRLTQQLTSDYTLNPHVWNEIADKINKMAEDNRLIKQAMLGTYEKMKGRYPISRTGNQNNPKDDSGKQISQSGK